MVQRRVVVVICSKSPSHKVHWGTPQESRVVELLLVELVTFHSKHYTILHREKDAKEQEKKMPNYFPGVPPVGEPTTQHALIS